MARLLNIYAQNKCFILGVTMKTKMLNLINSFLLLSVLVSCGKNQVSGGSQSGQFPMPPINNNYSTATGETVWNEVKNWVDGSSDNLQVGIHGIYLTRTYSGAINVIPSMCLKNTTVLGCSNPSGCFKSTSVGVMKGVVQMSSSTVLGITTKRYSDCDITSNFSLYTKASNQDLKDAVNGKFGQYLIKSLTQKTGSIYKVYFGSFQGSTSPASYAIINTSLPSIVNPTEVGSIGGGNITRLIDYRIVQ